MYFIEFKVNQLGGRNPLNQAVLSRSLAAINSFPAVEISLPGFMGKRSLAVFSATDQADVLRMLESWPCRKFAE
jgi:hypothetical protein